MATIYVELLDEGVQCWRPVAADKLGDDLFRITDECPDGESWAFGSREIVRCRPSVMGPDPGGMLFGPTVLVAFERITLPIS